MSPQATTESPHPDTLAREVAANAKTLLAGGDYGFCTDPYYPLTHDEVSWCPLLGDKSELCPALVLACKRGATVFGRRGYPRGEGEAAPEPDPWVLRLPNLGALGSVLFWSLIAAGAAALVYAILKNTGRWKRKQPEDEEPREALGELPPPAARKALETDVDRLLARARRAASEGRLLDATAAAHAALLRQLEGEELIRVHPSSTNGDYVRELAPHPGLRGPVRDIVRDVERVQFGHEEPTAGTVESVIDRVTALVRSRAAAPRIGALGVVSMLLLAAALGSCRLGRGPWERTPSGNGAVIELLARSGLDPKVRFQSFAHLPEHDAQVVLLPGATIDRPTWERLLEWTRQGGTLITTEQEVHLKRSLGVEVVEEKQGEPAARVSSEFRENLGDLRVAIPGLGALKPMPEGPRQANPDENENEDARQFRPILSRGDSTYAAELDMGDGRLVVLADDRLFTNASLAVPDNAAFLVAMLRSGGSRIEIAGELVGRASPSPLASVKRSNLWPLMLQLGALLFLLFLCKGIAFGMRRDPAERSRRRFVEHVRALGLSYNRAHASRHASMLFATFALERLRERTRLGQGKGIVALADGIAVRSGRPLGECTRILVQAEEAREPARGDEPRSSREEHLTLIRELSTLLRQVGGGSK